jgi:F-type H+-transporting ATPase subunit b
MSELLQNPEFWEAVAFVLAVALVWRKGSTAIGDMLDDRAKRIKAELDEARNLRDEAQRMLTEYQLKQRDALNEAAEIIAHAKTEAERYRLKAAEDLEAMLLRRERQAEEKIAQAEAKAIAEVRNHAADLAIAAARHLVSQDLDPARASALIDEGIAGLAQRLN